MKLTVLLLTTVFLQVHASSFSQAVTFNGKNVPLQKVFSSLESQSGYFFFYDEELLNKTKLVTVSFSNVSLTEALRICLKNQPLDFSIKDKTIFIREKKGKGMDDEGGSTAGVAVIDVKGKVVNEKGEPVVATVTVKGTSRATTTNEKGEFELKGVEEDAVLVVSGVNIETQEIRVSGRGVLPVVKVVMRVGMEEEVVISTGYQKVSKERFVGSYSQMDSAAYHRRVGMGIIERLNGNVTGMLFDDRLGGRSGSMQIRGVSTINSNSTLLIIVDGFPYLQNLNLLNPNDVEDITILKDAAATSIWGSRAGNGVVVITTKKGKYNQPFQINMASNVTIQEKPDLHYFPQIASTDFIDIERFLFNRGYYNSTLNNINTRPAVTPVVEILNRLTKGLLTKTQADEQINALRDKDLQHDLDEHLYQNKINQQYYLNFSGGTNSMNYGFSLGYNRNGTPIQEAKADDQFTLASNVSFRATKKLDIQAGINLSQSTARSIPFALPFVYPYEQLRDESGKALATPNQIRLGYVDTAGIGKLLDWHYYPLDEIRLQDVNNVNRSVLLDMAATYKVTNWLNAGLSGRYSVQTNAERNYNNMETYFTRSLVNQFTNLSQTDPILRNPLPIGGILDIGNGQSRNYGLRAQLDANKSWGTEHIFSGMLVGEITETKSSNSSQRFYGYDNDLGIYNTNIDYLNSYREYGKNSLAFIPKVYNITEGNFGRTVSLLANASYTYAGRYTLYASARRDGANIFGENTNNKWKPLWSAGGSWDVSKETFYKVYWAPYLKLRISHGYSGNSVNISALPTIQYISSVDFRTGLKFASVVDPPNPDLRWEKVEFTNIGVDFRLLKDRISGSIDWYGKKTTDLIASIPMAPTSGATVFIVNSASLKGHGFELGLQSMNTTGILKWNTSFGLSYNKMKVTKLYQPRYYAARDFISSGLNATEGRMVYSIASYRWAGLDPATGNPLGYLNGNISNNYTAISSDSVDHQVFHGSSIPLYYGFINNSFNYRHFTLSANITYSLQYYFRKTSYDYSQISSGTIHADYYKRWKSPGDELITQVPSMIYPVPASLNGRQLFYAGSEINVLRGDHIRWQDVRLDYQLDRSVWKSLPVKSVQLFVYVNNLNIVLWRKNKSGYDPDFAGLFGAFSAPVPRTWTGGLNIQF